jgi:hypothetical protein
MKKTIIFVIVGILMSTVLFAEEPLAFKVTVTSDVYKKTSKRDGYDIEVNTLQRDDIVYSNKKASMDYIRSIDNLIFLIYLEKPNDGYGIHVKNLSPVNTENVFGKEIFIDYPLDLGDTKEMWVPSYYCYVLKSKNREKLLEFNPTLEKLNDPGAWYQEDHISDIKNGRCMFYNAAIMIGFNTHFLVKNIKKTEYGYTVNCIESILDFGENPVRGYYQPFRDTGFWDKYNPGDEMTLYLYLDGDYMDIYVDGKDLHLGTIVKVKKEFIEEYQSLIRNNTCNLSRITSWPRRADGSMDYPPPSLATDADVFWVEDKMPKSAIEKKAITQNNGEASTIPLWAWFAIIGGAVVVIGGGAALFVIKRKA